MAEKSRDAFRTISEVADWLDVPTHVLRFWESRFSQIKPVKRAGGRRYYRPSDMRVIGGVKVLLHDQGMTIRGVQKLFREEGIKHVSGFAPELFGEEAGDASPVLNEEALEQAARPAAAARSTRDAEPDPVPLTEKAEAGDSAEEEPVMFRRASSQPKPGPEPADPAPAPAMPPERPAIPATPDVPETDAADDAAEHARGPGMAARLRLADRARLASHGEVLAATADRLRAVLDRAG